MNKSTKSKYYSHESEFQKLPSILQKLVGSANQLVEWNRMSDTVLESVVASNFMRSYRAKAANVREYEMLPADAKKFMGKLSEKMNLNNSVSKQLTEAEVNERRNEISRQLTEAADERVRSRALLLKDKIADIIDTFEAEDSEAV
jgi:hypothetical protein